MEKNRNWLLIGVVLVVGVGVLGTLAIGMVAFRSSSGNFGSAERVGVIEINGPISDAKRILKDIKNFAEKPAVKSVVIRVNSPGGEVAPSQEIHDAVRRLAEKKHVIVSMGSLAASGGYYIAVAGEKVYANPGTLTGSIGVIMQVPNVTGLMKWAGVNMTTITAGTLKDAGNPFREMKDEERAYFEAVLRDVHEQFIEAVARGRKMEVDAVRPLADGRIFSGRQAKAQGLVDELGGIDDAIRDAATMGGIRGDPKVEYPHRDRPLLEQLLSGSDDDANARSWLGGLIREALGGQAGLRLQPSWPGE